MPPEIKQVIVKYLDLIIDAMVPKKNLEFKNEGEQWRITLETDNNEVIIGENGQTLSAIQHLIRTLVHRAYPQDRTHFILDVTGFRSVRENNLTAKIPGIVQQSVLTDGKTIVLVGLSSYERLLVHRCLSDITGIETMSVGAATSRKLLIMPTSDVGTGGIENAIIINVDKIN